METQEEKPKSNVINGLLKFVGIVIILIGLSFWRSCNKERIMEDATRQYHEELSRPK